MRKLVVSIAALSTFICQPVLAQEADSDNDDTAEKIALLSFLGLTAPDGKTELKDGAGEMEANILAARLLDVAAENIRTKLKSGLEPDAAIVLLADEEKLGVISSYGVRNRLDILLSSLKTMQATVSEQCPSFSNNMGGDRILGGAEVTAADLISLLRSDRTVSGISISPDTQAVLNAIASKNTVGSTNVSWIIPSEISVGLATSNLIADTQQTIAGFTPLAAGVCDKQSKQLKTNAQTYLSMANALVAEGEKGSPSPLENAIRFESLIGKNVQVLRIRVTKMGGTLVNKSNIWTTIGFNGVTVGGGLIATYRLIDPKSGVIHTSGSIVCSHPSLSPKQINRAKSKSENANCA